MGSRAEQQLDEALCIALSRAIRFSAKSRHQICEELSQRLGREVHFDTLNRWTSPNNLARRIPADAIPALCEILQSESLLQILETPERREALALGRSVGRWLDRKFK